MPSNQTPNYSLSQWSRDDRVLMEDFNADNAKLDAALAVHAAALAGKGNCRVETSGYIGQTSQDRLGLTHTLTFPKRPALVLIFGGASLCVISGVSDEVFYIGGYDSIHGAIGRASSFISWKGNAVTLSSSSRHICMDEANTQYQIVAWYQENTDE